MEHFSFLKQSKKKLCRVMIDTECLMVLICIQYAYLASTRNQSPYWFSA